MLLLVCMLEVLGQELIHSSTMTLSHAINVITWIICLCSVVAHRELRMLRIAEVLPAAQVSERPERCAMACTLVTQDSNVCRGDECLPRSYNETTQLHIEVMNLTQY
jgi:hypothetical protein